MLTITFHGHACFVLDAAGRRVIIDAFLTGNPAADIAIDRVPRVDAVLLSHGHGDHLGDAIPLAKRDGAMIVATHELAQFCIDHGAQAHPMHIGGAHGFVFRQVKLVPAFHAARSTAMRRVAIPPAPAAWSSPWVGGRCITAATRP